MDIKNFISMVCFHIYNLSKFRSIIGVFYKDGQFTTSAMNRIMTSERAYKVL